MTRKLHIDDRRLRMSRRKLLRLLPTGVGGAATLACEAVSNSIRTLLNSGVTMDKDFLVETSWIEGGLVSSVVDDGDGGELRLKEYMTLFRIRSDVSGFVPPPISDDDEEFTSFVPPAFEDDGMAVMVYLGDPNGLPNPKIGLFHARLDAADLEAVREAVTKINWRRVPPPVSEPTEDFSFHGVSQSLRIASGNLLIEHDFPPGAYKFLEAIAPLWDLLDELVVRTAKQPLGAITPVLDVTAEEGKPWSFKIRVGLRNIGSGPVVLTDPRVPKEPRPGQTLREPPRMSVKVNSHDIELPPLPEGAPRSLLIAPHAQWELEISWLAPKGGQYEVDMRWYDYDGPLDPVPGQMPFMPLPRKGPSLVGTGPYPVRGTCNSQRRFEAEP